MSYGVIEKIVKYISHCSRQNPQIQETNFGNSVSCSGNPKVLQLRKPKNKK